MTPAAAIPLADASVLRRAASRTRLVRIALALGLLAVLGAAVGAARAQPVHHSSFFPAGDTGVVVLDFSTSIDVAGYRRITNVLRPVVEANQPVGIVYFSDVGYLALPPATPGRELRPFLRFLRTRPPLASFASRRATDSAFREATETRNTPWSAAFRGGTRISSGLETARAVLRRENIDGTVLLISDLDNSLFDGTALAETLTRYRAEDIDLRIVPLFPSEDDRAYFRRVVGKDAFVSNSELLRNARATEDRSLQASFPVPVVVLGAVLLALVAANELLCGRLDWGRAEAHA